MSNYRDDREALHHRVAQLQQELDDARREGQEEGRDEAHARAAELEQRVRGMRSDLERMELELQAMRGADPTPRLQRRLPLVLLAIAIVLAIGTGIVVSSRKAPPVVVVAPPMPSPTPVPSPEDKRREEAPAETSTPATPSPPTSPATPSRSTTARWTAKVTRAEGLPVAAGTACTIEAMIVTSSATNAIVRELSILCGTQKLYRSTDKLEGMAQMHNDAREVLGPTDEKSTFTLMYRDIGTRSGERTQVDFDTTMRQGSVTKETVPRFRVDLSIPQTSAPTTPLAGAEQRMRRMGKITEVTTKTAVAGPVKSGTSCVLRAMPIGKGSDCVAEVACGGTVLWPSTAPVKCTYAGSRPTSVATSESASSEAGATSLALEGSLLTLKTKTLGATIALDE